MFKVKRVSAEAVSYFDSDSIAGVSVLTADRVGELQILLKGMTDNAIIMPASEAHLAELRRAQLID